MPPSFSLPRAPSAGESYLWFLPSIVNVIPGISGLHGDGSVVRPGPDVSGEAPVDLYGPVLGGAPVLYGSISDYDANPASGVINTVASGPFESGGGVLWGGFDVSDILPEGATVSGVYGCALLTTNQSSIASDSSIDCACGRLSPAVDEMWNYDGLGGANGDSGELSKLGLSGTSGQLNSSSINPPIDPSTGKVDWSIFSLAVRLFNTGFGSINDLLTVNGVALVVYYTGGHQHVAIGHGANLNAYDNGGYIAPNWPPGNGELLEDIEPLRNWCRANGISISLNQDSQRTAKDIVDEFLTVGNSAPVYSGDRLKTIPYDEVSAAGNGAIYIAPTASGPIADLDDKAFAFDGKTAPVRFTRKRRASCDNVVSIEHIDRNLDYAHNVTSEPDAMGVALYGPRKGGTLDAAELGVNMPSGSKALLCIHSAAVAQVIASILTKRSAAGVNEYQFDLKAEWIGLEAMDLVTITDPRLGLQKFPVRLTSVQEKDNRTLACTAEAFVYGLNHPDVHAVSAATGTLVNVNVDPGLVNTPIIFEPPAEMLASGSGPQVWFLVSGADPNYGGCIPFVSVDGGNKYDPLGGNIGPAITGVLTADYPSASDPDTTDTLAVDLTESNGSLSSQPAAIADGFADPCYVAGAAGSIGVIFEVICYTLVTMTSAEHFSLGSYIRRAVQGTDAMDHPTGMRFGAINGQAYKIDIPSQWIGKTVYFKFAAYNKIGTQQNQLPDCVAYPFTPTGGPSAEVYVDGIAVSFDDVVSVDGTVITGSSSVTVDGV